MPTSSRASACSAPRAEFPSTAPAGHAAQRCLRACRRHFPSPIPALYPRWAGYRRTMSVRPVWAVVAAVAPVAVADLNPNSRKGGLIRRSQRLNTHDARGILMTRTATPCKIRSSHAGVRRRCSTPGRSCRLPDHDQRHLHRARDPAMTAPEPWRDQPSPPHPLRRPARPDRLARDKSWRDAETEFGFGAGLMPPRANGAPHWRVGRQNGSSSR